MAQLARRMPHKSAFKRVRLWVLTLAGRLNDAAWSYDRECEQRANRALWTVIGALVVTLILAQLSIHYHVHVSLFGE